MAHQKDAGKADQSEIIRKIMFNFLQVSALAAGFPLHWPKELEALFDFQGAISTAGEHILSPDCSVQGITPAGLFYGKQIAFAFTPPALCVVAYFIWKSYSICFKIPWRERAFPKTHTPKDKMVVTICVLLYFFWPTLLNQTFRIFSCREIGTNVQSYLMADFEEPCYVGRHLLFTFCVGITQIILYAIGLPLLIFMFLHRHRHELDKPVVKFRYSLFFAGFRQEKYYWEVVVALRKESTVILAVFGPNMGTPMLAHVALLVFLIQILIQLVGTPYTAHQQKLQYLDVASIIVCWFTMWSGFFFLGVNQEWDKSMLIFLTMIVLSVNVVHMLVLVASMCLEICKEKKESNLGKRILNRTSSMVPTIIKQYREKKKRRTEMLGEKNLFNYENPVLESTLQQSLEMTTMGNSLHLENSGTIETKNETKNENDKQKEASRKTKLRQSRMKKVRKRLSLRQKVLNQNKKRSKMEDVNTVEVQIETGGEDVVDVLGVGGVDEEDEDEDENEEEEEGEEQERDEEEEKWEEHKDDDGRIYLVSSLTGLSTWKD